MYGYGLWGDKFCNLALVSESEKMCVPLIKFDSSLVIIHISNSKLMLCYILYGGQFTFREYIHSVKYECDSVTIHAIGRR